MRFYVLLLSVAALINLSTAVAFDPSEVAASCKRDGCVNTCQAQGRSCCFCDETMYYNLQACFCCPKDHFCCGAEKWKYGSAHCCPNGYTCSNNGTCSVLSKVPAVSAVGVSRAKCRPDINAYLTVDNSYRAYIDGNELTDLEYSDKWEIADKIVIPGNAKLITICGKNSEFKAGILASSDEPDIFSRAEWRCINSVDECPGKYTELSYDDSKWRPALCDEKNDGLGSRRTSVQNIPRNTCWKWISQSNSTHTVDWERFCTCRIWLPEFSYGFQ